MKKLIIVSFLVLLYTATVFSQVDPDTPVAKTFRLRYKKVEQILPLVRTVMSNKGVVTTSEEFNIFVVKDFPPNIIQVDSLVSVFDVPAKQIFVSVRLLYGFDPEPGSMDADIPTIPDSSEVKEILGQQYGFTKITEVDRGFIRTEEKSQTGLELGSGQYNVVIDIDYIPGNVNLVKFRTFAISEVVSSIQGKYMKPLINTSVEMADGTTELLAVFKKENTDKSLIVIVSVQSM